MNPPMLTNCKLALVILVLTLHAFAVGLTGSREAEPHSRPYMALVEQSMSNGDKKYCGGFLLSEDFVMTAAHCQAKTYTVKLGVHKLHEEGGVQSMTVEQAFPRNDYNESRLINDIMLLKLSSKAQFDEKVKPIELATEDDGSLPKSCTVSGWGKHDNSGLMSTVLREVNVTLIDNEDCDNEKAYFSEGEAGPAHGDGGGPLVCEGVKAYGVVSSVFKPKSVGPLVFKFAKIPVYRRWTSSITSQALKKIPNCNIWWPK